MRIKDAARRSGRMAFAHTPYLAASEHLLVQEVHGVPLDGLGFLFGQQTQGVFDFSTFDANSALAAGQFAIRGFPFVTPIGNPAWLLSELISSPGTWQTLLDDHIDAAFAHVGANPGFRFWGIVNEAIGDSIDPPTPYRGPWYDAVGDASFIDHAFTYAAAYWPSIPLMINDYGFEYVGPIGAGRRANMLAYLDAALTANVPISILGMQMHLRWGSRTTGEHYAGFDEAGMAAWLQSITALGLQVVITELDCGPDEDRPDLTAAEIDAANALLMRRALDVVLANADIPYVGLWALLDEDATYIANPALRRYGVMDNQGVDKIQKRALMGSMLSHPRVVGV